VTSCACVDEGFCYKNDKCFRGTNKSSTFAVSQGLNGTNSKKADGPMGVSMMFGSGAVTSIIATDVAQIGGVKSVMDDGLLLMVDRRQLKITGRFEGILGLGPLPTPGRSDLHSLAPGHPTGMAHPDMPAGKGVAYTPKLFLDRAGVNRFSLCFNDAAKPGALRMNVAQFKQPLPIAGSFHWGLGLYGMKVGSTSGDAVDAIVCDPHKMKEGQDTPCAAIPDSGTTLMMGPKDQVCAVRLTLQ